ncbi:MAG: putative ABC transporter permease [Bacilli bacterium]|nr:putative ABC transporter permease [Bacilli bacterium]
MKNIFDKYLNDKIKFERYQVIGILCLIFVFSGIFGWIYEFIFYYFNGGMKIWYMQGGNFLPWINIYAFGSILIVLTTYKIKKNPFLVFLISSIVTGLLEYIAGLLIFKLCNGLRLWDYNVEILNIGNIGGFVCLRSVLFFGSASLILMYLMLPFLIYLSKNMNKKTFIIMSISLFSIIMIDELYNLTIARITVLPKASEVYQSLGFKYVKFK